jgi:hypothetical protein
MAGIVPIPIEHVYGRVGSGLSSAPYVMGEDGNDYVAKGPAFVRNFKHIAANEFIGASLARELGLVVPDYCVLQLGKKLFFGSDRMNDGTFHPSLDGTLFQRCNNNDDAYRLAVLDTWICNEDRHGDNLLAKCSETKSKSTSKDHCTSLEHVMVVIDHDGAFLPDNREPSYFNSRLKTRVCQCVQLPFVRQSIVNPGSLREALDIAENVSKTTIAEIVRSVPALLLPPSDHAEWIGFIVMRQESMRAEFREERGYFTYMNAGAI